jgi:hypothetical protein
VSRRLILLVLLCCLILAAGCSKSPDKGAIYPGFDENYQSALRAYGFDFARWEINTLADAVRRQISAPLPDSTLTSETVVSYFKAVAGRDNLRTAMALSRAQNSRSPDTSGEATLNRLEKEIVSLRPVVERTLERQLTRVLADQDVFNPFCNGRLELTFPAVKFKLEKSLNLLVISPRDRIARLRDAVIRQDITVDRIEAVESSLTGPATSALIVPLGGLGATYPSFVVEDADMKFILDTVAEEWLHQYLAFTPLGRAYILHLLEISRNSDIAALNETVAGVAAQELGSLLYSRYYARLMGDVETDTHPPASAFDFNAAVRETRQTVDSYLSQGQVEAAEEYMRHRQQYLAENGYYIRKLNQAYFAFYGSYAYSPTSIDPLGEQVKSLRNNIPSLRAFLEAVSGLKSRQDLDRALNRAE